MEWRKKLKLLVVVALVVGFFGQVLAPVSADELDRLRREQEALSRQIQQREREVQQNQRQIKTATTDINRLERDIEKVQKDIAGLKGRLSDTEKKVAITEAELAEAEARLAMRTEALAARVKEIFINGQVNYLEVLLQSSSINDLLTRMVLLEKLMEQDMNLLAEIEAERAEIEEKKAALEDKKAEIVAIKLETERKEQQLLANNKDRQRWLASLETETSALENALDDLEKTSQEIAEKIRIEQAKYSKGEGISVPAAWPTPGYTRVSSDYGMRRHPILRAQRMHTGIDIAAPQGVKIVAVDFGRVIYADWLGGYGKAIIIDHGKGMSTLYAHQHNLLVKVGADVNRGQVIGKVGSTGQSTGPHLHFEVRKGGSPVNPWPYLK